MQFRNVYLKFSLSRHTLAHYSMLYQNRGMCACVGLWIFNQLLNNLSLVRFQEKKIRLTHLKREIFVKIILKKKEVISYFYRKYSLQKGLHTFCIFLKSISFFKFSSKTCCGSHKNHLNESSFEHPKHMFKCKIGKLKFHSKIFFSGLTGNIDTVDLAEKLNSYGDFIRVCTVCY